MASFNFLLDSPRDGEGNLKKKEVAIYLWVVISRTTKIALKTELKVRPHQWNFKDKKFSRTAKRSPELNNQLDELKAEAQVVYNQNRHLTREKVKKLLKAVVSGERIDENAEVLTMSRAMEVFQADMKGRLSENYLRGIDGVINYLRGRKDKHGEDDTAVVKQRDLPLNQVGADYMTAYVKWMIDDGYENSTIEKHTGLIKNVLSSQGKDVEVDETYLKGRDVKVPRKKPFWLSKEEMALLVNHRFGWKNRVNNRHIMARLRECPIKDPERLNVILDQRRDRLRWQELYDELSKQMPEFFSTIFPPMVRVKDEFLFRYYTGLRQQEVDQLMPYHFRQINGIVHIDFTMLKNSREFLMPIGEEALAILKKYNYYLPKLAQQVKDRLIKECFKEAGLEGLTERVSFSGSLRTAEAMPKYEAVGTHTARRSFGRRWMETPGNDIESLSQWYGHSSSAVTRAYIGWTLDEYVDMMRKIKF